VFVDGVFAVRVVAPFAVNVVNAPVERVVAPIEVLFNGKKPDKIKIKDLKPATKYHISIFSSSDMKFIESLSFVSLAKEPKEQAENIIFKEIKRDAITVLFKAGNGEKRLVFVSKDEKPALPVDGKNYTSNPIYGEKNGLVGGTTYCVSNTNEKQITISGLEHAEYYFQVFEYNGAGETANYLTKSSTQNPRSKVMPLPPPIALEAINLIEDGFTAKWEPVKGAIMYELIIGRDDEFTSVVEPYNGMDVGDISEMEVIEFEPGTYYYKVRAYGSKSKSDYSNIIKVEIK
jgi:hypothetical protein